MKNLFPVIAILAFASLTLISCAKEHSCKCAITALGVTKDTTISLGKVKKKNAETTCKNYQTTFGSIVSGGIVTANCSVN